MASRGNHWTAEIFSMYKEPRKRQALELEREARSKQVAIEHGFGGKEPNPSLLLLRDLIPQAVPTPLAVVNS